MAGTQSEKNVRCIRRTTTINSKRNAFVIAGQSVGIQSFRATRKKKTRTIFRYLEILLAESLAKLSSRTMSGENNLCTWPNHKGIGQYSFANYFHLRGCKNSWGRRRLAASPISSRVRAYPEGTSKVAARSQVATGFQPRATDFGYFDC